MTVDRRRLLLSAGLAGLAAACAAPARKLGAARLASGAAGSSSPSASASSSAPPSASSADPLPVRRRGPAREVVHGRRTANAVALTFHTAGDTAVVDELLRVARRHRAGLTMLVVGTWLEANPAYARRILAAGHDLGNHTWSHPVLADDDVAATRAEIVRCRALLHRLTGRPGTWFRPSGTPHATALMLREAGLAGYPVSLSYDVDPLDYTDPGAAAVTERVLASARGGSIVSLHTLYPGTAEALPRIIAGLRRRGLEPVATSRLLTS